MKRMRQFVPPIIVSLKSSSRLITVHAANKNNKTKVYALLCERCTKAMKNKVEAGSDYDRIKSCPIALLKAIKSTH